MKETTPASKANGGRTLVIDPVTRIEGHAKITIKLDDAGRVNDARFHVTQYRGFEKFCEGRPFTEMPSLTARTCGICPVSHLIASAKACDEILAVKVPETGANLRRILNLAQIIQSHALSFFYLSSPDFVLGMDGDPGKRNLFGVAAENPELAKDGIWLRKFGQQIIEKLAGKRIHPEWVVPGGVSRPLAPELRDWILSQLPEAITIAQRTLAWFKETYSKFPQEIESFANMQTLFLGLVSGDGFLEHYDGPIRVVDSRRKIIDDNIKPSDYQDYIAEAVEPDSYLKSPYYKIMGYPEGIYRVGPLARLNIAERCGMPQAAVELFAFRKLSKGAVLSSFHFHYARLIEILYGLERVESLLNEPGILDKDVRAFAGPNHREGVGISEAPRGTLIHHYKTDERGLITWANMIIATGHNNLAMNHGVLQVAKHFIKDTTIPEGALNRIEAVIRCYDPCLSCSTHAQGHMPLHVRLEGSGGELLDERFRE
jgi:NAD-reducing hydrogenase large subunit